MSENKKKSSSMLKIVLGVTGGGCLLMLVIIVGCFGLFGKAVHDVVKENEAKVERIKAAPISDVVWEKVDHIYNLESNFTDLQKDEHWNNYQGKKVKWTGTVSAVDEMFGMLSLQIKMNTTTFVSDLLIYLKDSERSKAVNLSEGDRVTFIGVLDDWGSLLPITLQHGEIVEGN